MNNVSWLAFVYNAVDDNVIFRAKNVLRDLKRDPFKVRLLINFYVFNLLQEIVAYPCVFHYFLHALNRVNDLIFPTQAQKNFWSHQAYKQQILEINAPHFAFFDWKILC